MNYQNIKAVTSCSGWLKRGKACRAGKRFVLPFAGCPFFWPIREKQILNALERSSFNYINSNFALYRQIDRSTQQNIMST